MRSFLNVSHLFPLVLLLSGPLRGESFIFFGDFGSGTQLQRDIARSMAGTCKKFGCDFAVTLGDNIYPKGVKSMDDPQFREKFEDVYCPLGIPVYMSLGNHDYDGDVEAQLSYSAKSKCWRLPSRYYSFSQQTTDFFAVDTESFGLAQVFWLREALSRSQKPWKIVFGHRPLWSYGEHGHTYELWPWLWPLVKAYHVDFYLSGHDHSRQVISGDGIQYVVSGAAGDPKDSVGNVGEASFAKGGGGYGHMELSETTATLRILNATGDVEYLSSFTK